MSFLSTLLISIVITIAVMPYCRQLALKIKAVDQPGSRKLHAHLMPRCGGMAMALGMCVPLFLWAPKTRFVSGLLIGALVIVIFGVIDDVKNLKPSIKLFGQTIAALLVIGISDVKINDLEPFLTPGVLLDWAAIPLTVFVIVGVTNATNLSDGLDGLAGGTALLIFLCIGYLCLQSKDWVSVMIAIAAGGSLLGFLRFNSYPAQLFMGDAGSQLLGFVAIVLAIKMAQPSAGTSAVLPLIIFGIPVLDTITVMIKRLTSGRSPFSADRNHFHHQLMRVGLLHTEAVLTIYLVQALLILFAIAFHGSNGWFLLSAYLMFAGGVLGTFHIFQKTGYRIQRGQFLNGARARLKATKDRGHLIKISFGIVKVGVPVLLIFNALFQQTNNKAILILSGGFSFSLMFAWFLNKKILNYRIAKLALYLFTPFIIFNCDLNINSKLTPVLIGIYTALYLLLLISVVLTIQLTRRTNGFKSSTLDYLVIFVILAICSLPDAALKGYLLGMVAVKTVILYYGYEVLIGEMRSESPHMKIP